MPTVKLKLNLTDKDRAAYAHRVGKPHATYSDIVTSLRRSCYRLLEDYWDEYEQDTESQDNTHKEQDG